MTLDELIHQAQALRAAGTPGDAEVFRRFMGTKSYPRVEGLTASRRYVLWSAEEQQQRNEPIQTVVLLE
jgi:hypothetical protein